MENIEINNNEDEKQKKIFSRMLNYYIALNGKQQIDVCNDLNIKPSTLNMWCKGNSIPGPGKIRALADYFHVGMSDLTEEKNHSNSDEEFADVIAKISLYDERFQKIIISYYNMPNDKKELLCDFFEKFIL